MTKEQLMEYINHPYFLPIVMALGWLWVVLMWGRGWWKLPTRLLMTAIVSVIVWYGLPTVIGTELSEIPKTAWIIFAGVTLYAILYKRNSGKSGRRKKPERRKKKESSGGGFWGGLFDRDSSTDVGYVYVISNPAYEDDIVKIGMTEQSDYMTRIRQLHDTSTPYPFEVRLVFETQDALGLEQELHEIFDNRRLNSNREFFEVSPREVLRRLPKIGNPRVVERNL